MLTRLTLEQCGASGRTVSRGGEPECPACPAAVPARFSDNVSDKFFFLPTLISRFHQNEAQVF